MAEATVFFVAVKLAHTVFVMGGGQGLTDMVMLFVLSMSPEGARRDAEAFLAGNRINTTGAKLSARPSVVQGVGKMTFPEQVLNAPAADVAEALRSRGFPERMVQESLAELASRQRALLDGRVGQGVAHG